MDKIETHTTKPETSFLENESTNLIIDTLQESILESKISDIGDYMKSKDGKGKSEDEKSEIYAKSQLLWHEFITAIKDAKYNFHLNRVQHKFLTDLILSKIEYDVNTVFFAIELTNMLGTMKDAKFVNDTDLLSFSVNATEMTYIYHLISKHKVKGLTRDAYTFSQILYRIGSISKIFNYYEVLSKNLAKDIQDWIVTLDDGVSIEEKPFNKYDSDRDDNDTSYSKEK